METLTIPNIQNVWTKQEIWFKNCPDHIPQAGRWLIIEYVSEDKNTRGQTLIAPGYYSEAFKEFKIHEPMQMSTAQTVTPTRWCYMN